MNKLFLGLLLPLLIACGNTPKTTAVQTFGPDDVVVRYFHGKQRCVTCNAIEQLTQEVVQTLSNPKVVMQVIDISQPEHQELVDQFEVSWSSLILQRGEKVDNQTAMGFRYAKTEPEAFKTELTKAINRLL